VCQPLTLSPRTEVPHADDENILLSLHVDGLGDASIVVRKSVADKFEVIGEMFAVGRRVHAPLWTAWGIVLGFLLANGTDLILTIGGL